MYSEVIHLNWQENPFYILQVSMTTTKSAINDKTDELCFDNLDNEKLYEKARGILLNPQKRIGAELCWFPGLTKTEEDNLLKVMQKHQPLLGKYDNKLVRMNVAIYNLTYQKKAKLVNSLLEIDDLYTNISLDNIRIWINEVRKKAKITLIQNNDVLRTDWNEVRHDISVTMQSVVKSMRRDNYVSLANEIANKLFGHKDFGVIIEDFFATYVLDMNSFILEQKEKISQLLQKVQGNPTDNNINRLELEVCSFTVTLRPLALMKEAKGISNDQELVSIYDKIYELSYDFCEKDNFETALSLLELLKKSFAFLPSVAKDIEDDINELKKYLSSKQPTAVFKEANEALMKILDEEDSKLKYEAGFSTEIMSFYNNEFCKCYQKMIEEILLRKGYQDEEYRLICYGAACLYKYMSSSLTWAERLDLAYPLAKRALQLAKSSKNKELIKAITDDVNEFKPVADSSSYKKTSVPSRNNSSNASANQPTALSEEVKEANEAEVKEANEILEKILDEEDSKLKYEAGFSAEIMSFYNNEFCNYQKAIEEILFRKGYQEYWCIWKDVSCINLWGEAF